MTEYKKNIYVREDWFACMSDNLFNILQNTLGWHLCITATKNN